MNPVGALLVGGDGARVSLRALIKSGGAGSVYRTADPNLVAKLYHAGSDLAHYERKLKAMLELSPELPDMVEGVHRYVQIAWPTSLLRDARGAFVGFLMPAIDVDATSELECVMQERQARAAGLPTGLGAKATLAANLAAVIAELHRRGHHLIDLKPVNLRFYKHSLYMAMLDCDGFSIEGEDERFDAPQYTPDYAAPECQDRAIGASGEEAQDRFALAVIVFQLMNFGIHPFTGVPANDRVPTDVPGRIAQKCYAYGLRGGTRLMPSPVSGHESMPKELRTLFDRAFEGEPAARPAAAEWSAVLRGYAQRSSAKIVTCTLDATHQHFATLACASCARERTIAAAKLKRRIAPKVVAPRVPAPAAPRKPLLQPRRLTPQKSAPVVTLRKPIASSSPQQAAQLAAALRAFPQAALPRVTYPTSRPRKQMTPAQERIFLAVCGLLVLFFATVEIGRPQRVRASSAKTPVTAPAPQPAPAPAPQSTSTLRLGLRSNPPYDVMHIDLGSKLDARWRVTQNQISFGREEPFALSVTAKRASGKDVRATWYLGDIKLKDETKTFGNADPAIVGFEVANAAPWPEGDYRVDLSTDAGIFRTLKFKVR